MLRRTSTLEIDIGGASPPQRLIGDAWSTILPQLPRRLEGNPAGPVFHVTPMPSSKGSGMDVREIAESDLELICRHREEMFRDAGRGEEVLQTMTRHFRDWLRPRLQDRTYFGFILSDAGQAIAGIGLMLIDWPPHPSHPAQDKRGYVLNVYVEPAYRRQGLARELMRLADAEFRRRDVAFAILHATEKGRGLYAGLGWNGTTEMSRAVPG
jgi:ribosomal protein S18 acetylase RimI-like enzyme